MLTPFKLKLDSCDFQPCSFISFFFFPSEMSVSHGHPQAYSQPQPQALPQPPQLLLSQPDLVLQLPLFHQQGRLHLHKVAMGENTQKNKAAC